MGRATKAATRKMAEEAEKVAMAEARRDLGGDAAFSGWRRGKPIPLDLQIKQVGQGALLMPTRSSAGPWTVAQRGRNNTNASGFSGPGVNRKTGLTSRTKSGALRKVRTNKRKRWNGNTRGKNTAARAVGKFDPMAEKIADKAMRTATRKHFD